MNNFRRLAGKSDAKQIGPVFSDSDPYKWAEAVGFALQIRDHPDLRATTDKMIDEIVAVQEPSGYLNTYYARTILVASHDTRDPVHRPRALLHRAHAAGRDRILPRHWRPHSSRCRTALCQ